MNIEFTTPAVSHESQRLSGFQPAGVVFIGGVMQEEKRWKRGDIRNDGKVYWGKQHGYELWLNKDKYADYCRVRSARDKVYNATKRPLQAQKKAIYNLKNREKRLAYFKSYYIKNRDRRNAYAAERRRNKKEHISQIDAAYRKKHRKKISELAWRREKLRLKSNPFLAVRASLRSRALLVFSRRGLKKDATSEHLLGCKISHAKEHIERQFKDGMSWSNRKEWHIDHIIPLSSAHDEYSLKMLFHYTNLRPVWISENLKKGSKWNPPEYCI